MSTKKIIFTGAGDPFATNNQGRFFIVSGMEIKPGECFIFNPIEKRSGEPNRFSVEVSASDIPALIAALTEVYGTYQADKPWLPSLPCQTILSLQIKYIKDDAQFNEDLQYADTPEGHALALAHVQTLNRAENDTDDILVGEVILWRMKLNPHGYFEDDAQLYNWEQDDEGTRLPGDDLYHCEKCRWIGPEENLGRTPADMPGVEPCCPICGSLEIAPISEPKP